MKDEIMTDPDPFPQILFPPDGPGRMGPADRPGDVFDFNPLCRDLQIFHRVIAQSAADRQDPLRPGIFPDQMVERPLDRDFRTFDAHGPTVRKRDDEIVRRFQRIHLPDGQNDPVSRGIVLHNRKLRSRDCFQCPVEIPNRGGNGVRRFAGQQNDALRLIFLDQSEIG